MDITVPFYASITVKVADWHEAPARAAEELVREALATVTRPEHDWAGRFAIATGANVTACPHSSD